MTPMGFVAGLLGAGLCAMVMGLTDQKPTLPNVLLVVLYGVVIAIAWSLP